MQHAKRTSLPGVHHVLLAAGALILAADPVLWLFRSWTDPAYGSYGWVFLGLTVGLFVFSLTSPLCPGQRRSSGVPVLLLCGSALIRLAGQVLDINTISALTLCLDIYALARLAGLDARVRAVSPLWLAAVFFFSLPVERLLQRSVGYALQELSAAGACNLIGLIFGDTSCSGVQIDTRGQSILVDLPCSGTAGLTLVAALFALAATIARPDLRTALIGIALVPAGAVIANAFRVTGLTVGLVLAPVDVMAEPWHSLIGLLTLGLSALPPLWLLQRGRPKTCRPTRSRDIHLPLGLVAMFPLIGLLIVAIPHAPLDRSDAVAQARLPSMLQGYPQRSQPLSTQEIAYFQQYGGSAAKAQFGPMALLLTHTKSPLRHLHDPQDCLRGLGYAVEFIGTRAAPIPTAVYRVTDLSGGQWRAEVSFYADRTRIVPSVSAAVWHWMAAPGAVWSGLQRITPWDLPEPERAALEQATLAALDLTTTERTTK